MQARASVDYPAASSRTELVRASLTHTPTHPTFPAPLLSPPHLPPPPSRFIRKINILKRHPLTGAINVMTPAIFLLSTLTFFWPFVRGTRALVSLALLYGASLGAFVAILSAPMITLGDSTDVGRRTGTYLTILSLCSLAGPPISGAIYHATGGYSVVGIYAGLYYFLVSVSPKCHRC